VALCISVRNFLRIPDNCPKAIGKPEGDRPPTVYVLGGPPRRTRGHVEATALADDVGSGVGLRRSPRRGSMTNRQGEGSVRAGRSVRSLAGPLHPEHHDHV
jgi:hypothetical protein